MKLSNLNITNKESTRMNKIRQVQDFLQENYKIRINKFNPIFKRIESLKKKYEFDIDFNEISLHLQENDISIGDTTLRKILNSPNYIQHYNPIEEYFNSLKWEGISHIEKLCSLITAKDFNDKTQEGYYQIRMIMYFKKWLVSAVACSMHHIPNEVSMGFIQEQEGTGKTTLVKMLTPSPLKEMQKFSDKDKKVFNMRKSFTENFIVIFDEFEAITPHTSELFKSTMSAEEIDIKEPNDPFPKRRKRICNAVFTSNNKTGRNKGFLFAGVGTRRFLCFHIDHIDYEKLVTEVNIDQVWAEALMLYHGNFQYKFDPKDFAEFKEYNTRYIIETNAVQVIQNNYQIPDTETETSWMQATQILEEIKTNSLATRENILSLTPESIGIALNQLGFLRKPRRINGQPRYAYAIKKIGNIS